MNQLAVFALVVLFAHWLADFVFQSDRMAKNKSKSWRWLGIHIAEYAFVVWSVMAWWAFLYSHTSLLVLLSWTSVNAALHFVIDAGTSRWSSYLYSKGQIHNFFVVIGFDQFLHLMCFVLTSPMLQQ